MDLRKDWADVLTKAGAGKPGTIKDRLLSEDKSQRYKQIADLIAAIDRSHAEPRLVIDGWLNRIDAKSQLTPGSGVHDLKWNNSTDIQLGTFELHVSRKQARPGS